MFYDDSSDDDYKAALGVVYERATGFPFACCKKVRAKMNKLKEEEELVHRDRLNWPASKSI